MRESLSTTSILDLSRPQRHLKYVQDAGFCDMMLDLGMFYTEDAMEYHGTEKAQTDVGELYKCFELFVEQGKACQISFDCMRAPHLCWDTKREDLNDLLLKIGEECIRACRRLGCQEVVIQPLFAGIAKCERWKANYSYYFRLGRLALENEIHILLENQCNAINGHLVRGVCSDMDTVSKFVDELNGELGREILGFCLNTKACSLSGQDMGEMAARLGKRLKAVLIRECDDIYGVCSLPGVGGSNVRWLSLIRALRRIEYDGWLIMDAGSALHGFSHLLRPQLYPVLKSVCDFFCWQIEIEQQLKRYPKRVLFGAGKMCQNYMKCYGNLYPPLFVCDNNPRLWGTRICGLEVRSPEDLQSLPKDCGVIICNMFYDEIAEQVQAMGIRNIAAFNDEYMNETISHMSVACEERGGQETDEQINCRCAE